MTEVTEAYDWRGRTAVGQDGERLGEIKEVYVDGESDKPEWATVRTGLFGTRTHFVPLAGARPEGEDVRLRVNKQEVKDAPNIDPDGELSEPEEQRLFEHYGVPYTTEGSTTAQGAPGSAGNAPAGQTGEGQDTSGPNTDEAMTRSEEELRVGTASRERGRVRLRKYIVTEQVQTTVPVQREEVRLEREPITDANVDRATSGPEISEEEHEVVLHEEEPVVEKRVVPKERVRLGTETVSEEREVSEQVRKEQIETDGAEG